MNSGKLAHWIRKCQFQISETQLKSNKNNYSVDKTKKKIIKYMSEYLAPDEQAEVLKELVFEFDFG
jgi:hypothetical protein